MDSAIITRDLTQHGYCVVEKFLSEPETRQLARELDLLHAQGKFRAAGIGRGENLQRDETVRRDQICWFEKVALLPAQQLLWEKLETLKHALNQELLLGLWELEGHYAIYEPGAFYRKHVDRFRDDDTRVVSMVLYLNDSWVAADGGELRIYPDAASPESHVDIAPLPGTLVCFLSARLPHEVRPAHRQRRSFAGWYRRRPTGP